MNKLQIIFGWFARILVILIALLSLVFAFVEIRKLIFSEFLIDQSYIRSFIVYFVRALGFIFMTVTNVLCFLSTFKTLRKKVIIWALFFSCASIVIPISCFFYMETIVAIGLLFFSLLIASYELFIYLTHKNELN
jgi:hypothetical protein